MNPTFSGYYFDGETLAGRPVGLRVAAGRLYLDGLEPPVDVSLADVRASDRLGSVPCFLYLPGRQTVETADHDAVAALVALQQGGGLPALIHWLEQRSRVAAAATVMLVTALAATVYFGLPVLAEKAAFAVPEAVEVQAGQAALRAFNRFLAPSQLGSVDRLRVTRLVDRLVQQRHLTRKIRVEFRSMGGKNPNAFALPGGIIVVSDELVALADSDEELMAVLAHELGHVERRHALQSVLRGSAALLVVSTVTGDLSTLTSFSATIPLTLLQRGYSREFETEADDYAVATLRAAKVDPAYFASILEKLEKSRPAGAQDYSYLSTHPSSADRIQRINPSGRHPPPAVPKMTAFPSVPLPVRPDPALLTAFEHKTQVTELSPHDVHPSALRQPGPRYPSAMALHSLEGDVVVEFVVTEKGDVESPRIVKSTYKEFEPAAVAAVLQWKFTPARHFGRPVAVLVSQTVAFRLTDLPAAPKAGETTDDDKPVETKIREAIQDPRLPPPK